MGKKDEISFIQVPVVKGRETDFLSFLIDLLNHEPKEANLVTQVILNSFKSTIHYDKNAIEYYLNIEGNRLGFGVLRCFLRGKRQLNDSLSFIEQFYLDDKHSKSITELLPVCRGEKNLMLLILNFTWNIHKEHMEKNRYLELIHFIKMFFDFIKIGMMSKASLEAMENEFGIQDRNLSYSQFDTLYETFIEDITKLGSRDYYVARTRNLARMIFNVLFDAKRDPYITKDCIYLFIASILCHLGVRGYSKFTREVIDYDPDRNKYKTTPYERYLDKVKKLLSKK